MKVSILGFSIVWCHCEYELTYILLLISAVSVRVFKNLLIHRYGAGLLTDNLVEVSIFIKSFI